MTTIAELKGRIERLKRQQHPGQMIVLFGNQKPPENLTEQDVVFRFEAEDEGVL